MKEKKLKNKDLILQGERILVRPVWPSDAEDIFRNIQDKLIFENTLRLPWPYKKENLESFMRYVRRSRRKGMAYVMSIVFEGEVVGIIDLMGIDFEHEQGELGYWIGKKFRGKGIMTEAGHLMLGLAFEKLKLNKVGAWAYDDNPASQKVMKKLGMKKEGHFRKHKFRAGRWRDDLYFAILKEEYK